MDADALNISDDFAIDQQPEEASFTGSNTLCRSAGAQKSSDVQRAACTCALSVSIFLCGHIKFEHAHGEAACEVFKHDPRQYERVVKAAYKHDPRQYERVVKASCKHDRCNHSLCASLPVDAQGMELAAQSLERSLRELQESHNAKRQELDLIPRGGGQDVQLDLCLGQAQSSIYKSSSNLSMCRTWIGRAGQRRLLPRQCRGYSKAYSIILKTVQTIEGNLQMVEAGLAVYRAQHDQLSDVARLCAQSQGKSAAEMWQIYKSDDYGQEFDYGSGSGHFLDEEMDDEGYWTRITFAELL